MTEVDEDPPRQGEVLPNDPPIPPDASATWLALVRNYTERPDLFLAEVERHDPGFIKRMNKATEERAERTDAARFHFGKTQAYAGLVVMIVAAFAVLGMGFLMILNDALDFWGIVGLAVFYAVVQGGTFGFHRIIQAVSDLIRGRNSPPSNGT